MRKRINKYNQFINEKLSSDELNRILDKISEFGIDSLSNHERTLLDSHSDDTINVDVEVEEHINRYGIAKEIPKRVSLHVDDSDLEMNIGRYVRFKKQDNGRKLGLFVQEGMLYEIVSIQKHWGYVDGKYVSNKIGYRLAEIGKDNDFGRVGDVDEVEFVNISEEDAIINNKEIYTRLGLD